MARVFLSIGSNIEPEKNLKLAIRELGRLYGHLQISPVYKNKAVGFDGDDFLNLVVGLNVGRSTAAISADLETIHDLAGRHRGDDHFSARPLDIDILLRDQEVQDGPPARLPRPDILRYSFVLKPLTDIAPDHIHPLTGRSYAEHWQAMAAGEHVLHAVALDWD